MVNLHFETAEEFEDLFKRKSIKVTDAIVSGIEKALTENKKSAPLKAQLKSRLIKVLM